MVALRQDWRGSTGLNLDDNTPNARRAVVVTAVAFGSSAANAGVLPGDELLAIAGHGVEPGGLQEALEHLRAEEQRLQRLHGAGAVEVDWRFYRPAGPMPQLSRTKSPVRFSPARVRTFALSPREEEEKRKHWHAIHGASEQQYVDQEKEEESATRHAVDATSLFQPHPAGTQLEELYTSVAVVIQKHERGRQQRAACSNARAARQRAALKLQSARRGQLARRSVQETKVIRSVVHFAEWLASQVGPLLRLAFLDSVARRAAAAVCALYSPGVLLSLCAHTGAAGLHRIVGTAQSRL